MTRKQGTSRSARKKQDKVALKLLVLLAWVLVGLYAGIAGWTDLSLDDLQRRADEVGCDPSNPGVIYNETSFCSEESVLVEIRAEEITRMGLQWISHLPDPLPLLLTAFSFGVIGTIVRIFRNAIRTQGFSNFYLLTLSPALGGLTALMLLGLSLLLPSAFSNAKISINPSLVPFLSLFAGAFSDDIQKWFQSVVEKIAGSTKEKNDAT